MFINWEGNNGILYLKTKTIIGKKSEGPLTLQKNQNFKMYSLLKHCICTMKSVLISKLAFDII